MTPRSLSEEETDQAPVVRLCPSCSGLDKRRRGCPPRPPGESSRIVFPIPFLRAPRTGDPAPVVVWPIAFWCMKKEHRFPRALRGEGTTPTTSTSNLLGSRGLLGRMKGRLVQRRKRASILLSILGRGRSS